MLCYFSLVPTIQFNNFLMIAQYKYSSVVSEYNAPVYVKRRNTFHLDSSPDLLGELKACWHCYVSLKLTLTIRLFGYPCCFSVTLYNCSVGRSDCSRCHTADHKYGCVWCGGAQASCLYSQSCSEPVQQTCPAPVIHNVSVFPPVQKIGVQE